MQQTRSEEGCNGETVQRTAVNGSALQPIRFAKSLSDVGLSQTALVRKVSDITTTPKREEEIEEDLIKRGIHPELTKKLFLYDADTNCRITPNSGPFTIDNDCFSGTIFLMIRTPDVDGKANEGGNFVPSNGTVAAVVSRYFGNKKRQFEFQFQGKLKKLPPGPLYLGCELDKPVKMNMVQKALVATVLNVVGAMNPGLHHSFGDKSRMKEQREAATNQNGRYEKAHLAFLLESSMDRIVVSKPGETLPKLGMEIEEDPASVKRRKRIGTGSVAWNTEDTYTMSFWSAYVDYIKWKCKNLPGVRPFPLSTVVGDQTINLTVYSLKESRDKSQHLQSDKERYTHLRIENRGPR